MTQVYSIKELEFCYNMPCIVSFPSETFHYPHVVDDIHIMQYYATHADKVIIVAIPEYDKVRDTKLMKLIIGDINE